MICIVYEVRGLGSANPALGKTLDRRGNFKTCSFAQSLRQAKILILKILNVFLWLKSSPSLTLNKIEHFETASEGLKRHFEDAKDSGFKVVGRNRLG